MLGLVSLFLFLIATAILGLLLWFVLAIARACIRIVVGKPSNRIDDREPPPFTRRAVLLSGALTALLFGNLANTVVREPIALFFNAYRNFATTIAFALRSLLDDNIDMENLPGQMVDQYSLMGQELGRQAESILYAISVPTLAAAIAVFILTAGAFSSGGRQSTFERVKNWHSGLTAVARNRLGLSITFFAGGYLSLAAIIAIPWLQSIGHSESDAEAMLLQRLTTNAGTMEAFDQQLQLEDYESPTSVLDGRLVELRSKVQNVELQQAYDVIGRYIEGVNREIETFQSSWAALGRSLRKQRQEATLTAQSAYERYSDTNLSSREHELFMDDLVAWHREILAQIDATLLDMRMYLEFTLDARRRWANEALQEVLRAQAREEIPYVYDPTEISFAEALRRGPFAGRIRLQPPGPRDVSGLGVFGFVADWLVSTRQLPLALISGMIGFGLLGSVVSRALRGSGEVTLVPVMDVVLVGISAAVIVFLAALGGLAVIGSSPDADPNPYVLFLACLVGAAYGDRVWATARDRFLKATQQTETVDDSQSGAGGVQGSGSGGAGVSGSTGSGSGGTKGSGSSGSKGSGSGGSKGSGSGGTKGSGSSGSGGSGSGGSVGSGSGNTKDSDSEKPVESGRDTPPTLESEEPKS